MAANKTMLTTPVKGPKITALPRISAALALDPDSWVRLSMIEVAMPWTAAKKKSVALMGRSASSRNTRRGLNQTSFSGRMDSVVDTKAAYAIRENDSSAHTQMTADFFRATLTASSNDVQEKSDHGKKEQVEKTQDEASGGKGQASVGQP